MTITNVAFENVQGHGIIGMNLLNNIVIRNITINCTMQVTVENRKSHGIAFLYNDNAKLNTTGYQIQHNVQLLIESCHFMNLNNKLKRFYPHFTESMDKLFIKQIMMFKLPYKILTLKILPLHTCHSFQL